MSEPLDDKVLRAAGLQLQGVVNTVDSSEALPESALKYRQLLIFGHLGSVLWDALPRPIISANPFEEYSIQQVTDFLARHRCDDYQFLYPSNDLFVDLRGLGKRLGWQHVSKLGIGIHPVLGTWFAYRVVVAANTCFETTSPDATESPCLSCSDKPCVAACPVGAVQEEGNFNLQACMEQRLKPDSSCADRCVAREACPVGGEYRYGREQIAFHSAQSLRSLREFAES